jgi:hypothetical protein
MKLKNPDSIGVAKRNELRDWKVRAPDATDSHHCSTPFELNAPTFNPIAVCSPRGEIMHQALRLAGRILAFLVSSQPSPSSSFG